VCDAGAFIGEADFEALKERALALGDGTVWQDENAGGHGGRYRKAKEGYAGVGLVGLAGAG
jgi:hypothetical protein